MELKQEDNRTEERRNRFNGESIMLTKEEVRYMMIYSSMNLEQLLKINN